MGSTSTREFHALQAVLNLVFGGGYRDSWRAIALNLNCLFIIGDNTSELNRGTHVVEGFLNSSRPVATLLLMWLIALDTSTGATGMSIIEFSILCVAVVL